MHPLRMVRQALRLALLVTLVVLALSACDGGEAGGQEDEANKPRPLPENNVTLRPGEYRSVEFEPSLSFRVGEGWIHVAPELPDKLAISPGREGGDPLLIFRNLQQVYKPTKSAGTPNVVEAPEDMVGWFQNHPYLKTEKPQPVTIGGVKGEQFDMVAEVPEEHVSMCGTDCVDAIKYTGEKVVFFEGDKIHAIVLEDVKGEAVYLDYGGLASDYDKVAPEAQKLVESVKWGGS